MAAEDTRKWKRKKDLNEKWKQRREAMLVTRGFKKTRLLSIRLRLLSIRLRLATTYSS